MSTGTMDGFLRDLAILTDRETVGPDETLGSLQLDSLGRVELAVLIEQHFGSRALQNRTFEWRDLTAAQLISHARQTRRATDFRFAVGS